MHQLKEGRGAGRVMKNMRQRKKRRKPDRVKLKNDMVGNRHETNPYYYRGEFIRFEKKVEISFFNSSSVIKLLNALLALLILVGFIMLRQSSGF